MESKWKGEREARVEREEGRQRKVDDERVWWWWSRETVVGRGEAGLKGRWVGRGGGRGGERGMHEEGVRE